MIDLGDAVRLEVFVRDANDTLVDAPDLALSITKPDRTTVSPAPTITHVTPGAGHYTYDYLTGSAQPGRYLAKWLAVSPIPFAHIEEFDIEQPQSMMILSLSSVKSQLRIDAANTASDEDLRGYILSVSESVEYTVGVCAVRDFTQEFVRNLGTCLMVRNVPVVSLTSVTPRRSWQQTFAPSDLEVNKETGEVLRLDGGCFVGDYDVATVSGRPFIAASIRKASEIILAHLWATRRGVPVVTANTGDLVQLPGWGYLIPSRAAELLKLNNRTRAVFS